MTPTTTLNGEKLSRIPSMLKSPITHPTSSITPASSLAPILSVVESGHQTLRVTSPSRGNLALKSLVEAIKTPQGEQESTTLIPLLKLQATPTACSTP
ncbi:hypothetical protein RSOL_491060, partial [Rhizoctonia solani AG-3 Rhs1AP]